ncbi:MarR family winged helix-turn-helix transcriptional regulator [Isoptericola sp. NPDC056605]|uniref:MarR family winged helix-turn-helix transcriptional regulator n=1 Tax=Isoptericola sp. NPDC056605 TaxID=3345876 RepID=UPI0036AEF8B9
MDSTRRLAKAQYELNSTLRHVTGIPHTGIAMALKALAHRGPMSLTDLAEILAIDRSVMSRHIAWLVDEGHAQRTVDAADRRARTVTLTASGQALHHDLQAELRRRTDHVFGDWDTKDLEGLAHDVSRLAATLSAAAHL